MSRYLRCFEQLKTKNQGAFVPFVVLGDPEPCMSERIIHALIKAGADALELGFPFSDPLADGPVIQGAMDRALSAGVTPEHCFEMIRKIREHHAEIPIGLLVYANIVYAYGVPEFYQVCKESGVDSVLVADVPVCESTPFCEAAEKAGVDPILLCPPNIDEQTIQFVAERGSGYTYLLSRAGVTGTNVAAGRPVEHLLKQLEQFGSPPPLLGFGISQPEHVRNALDAGAEGVIVGSAIVKFIESQAGEPEALISDLTHYAASMKQATVL